jgi:hypothetical protein
MYGNCLTFAIYDFIKNGGELCISFHKHHRFPHFTVQRDEKVYDLEIVTMILKELWYDGDIRVSSTESYNRIQCKRFRLAKRRITTIKLLHEPV